MHRAVLGRAHPHHAGLGPGKGHVMATQLFAGFLTSSRRSLLLLTACAAIGGTGATITTGCQTIPFLADAVVRTCVQIVSELLDLASLQLPAGYELCGAPIVWTVHDGTLKACLYCSKSNPGKVYVQLDCSGKFYPMYLRPIERKPRDVMEDVSPGEPGLYKVFCDELFLTQVQAQYNEWQQRISVALSSPNLRMLPSTQAYRTLTVVVDGVPMQSAVDFDVEFGSMIALEGDVAEVAHYAMNAGVDSIMFEDQGKSYEIHMNREISAMMVFANERCIYKRFLFAPNP